MLGLTSVTLSWTPAPNSTSQVIQYKSGAGTWENYITLDGTTNTWILTGLITNTIYSLRIVSYQLYCDPLAGPPDEIIDITCPTVTLDYGSGYVNYSFTHLDYDISGYTVDLLNLSDVVVDTIEEGITSPVTGEFTSLTPGSYKIRVTVKADQFERVCTAVNAILFGNVELDDPFTRNNCPVGYYGTTINYVVLANTYYALTQIAADALAQADINANGQAWVNINGLCIADSTYANVYTSATFTRNDCPVNYSGTNVLYEVIAGTYTSLISQLDADNQAAADIAANGQTYANVNGDCIEDTRYYNTLRTADYTRDNCTVGFYGSIVTYSVLAGTYFTYTSVADANILADADLAANGQAYANANGTCVEDNSIGNEERSQIFYKNDCIVGDECYQYTLYNTGGTVLNYSYRPCNGSYSYGVLAIGANIILCCEYVTSITIDFGTGYFTQGSLCSTLVSASIGTLYTVPANTYFSYSLATANAEADADIAANGQANANTLGTCDAFGNIYKMQTFQKTGCSAGYTGSYVDYEVLANTYYAATQVEADALADADIATNGQTYTNTNGICIADTIFTVVSVDMYNDANLDVCAYIDTPGVAESGVISARNGLNFYPSESIAYPQNAYILSSDDIAQPTLKRRFEFNIGRLINEYPDDIAIPEFIFKIRGRSTVAGLKSGLWQREYPTSPMIMTGSPGTYIPSTSPTGGPPATSYNANVISGGDGTVGIGVGNVILTFTYTRSTNTVSLVTA